MVSGQVCPPAIRVSRRDSPTNREAISCITTRMQISRRAFVGSLAAAAAARVVRGQEPSPWKAPVLDGHLHLRREVAANLTHMDGCGVTKAIILARDTAADQINEARKQSAARLVWAASTDIATPGAEARLTEAVKKGALGFAEMKFRVAADSAEFQRIYALAGELGVPIMIHFQEVPHSQREIPCDMALLALGFLHPQHEGLLDQLEVERDEKGNVRADEKTYQTSIAKIFTAGDMRRGQSLVVWAIQEGRQCAEQVNAYLSAK